jgi:hypothetical protein
VVTEESKKLEKEMSESDVVAGPAFGQQDVWNPPPKRDSAPVSNVVSSERAPKRTEHFSSVRQDTSPKPKSAKAPVKRRAAKKRKASPPTPTETETEHEANSKPQTFEEEDDFSDFSF